MIKVTGESWAHEHHGAGVRIHPNGVAEVVTPAGIVVYPAGEWTEVTHEEDTE